MKKSTILLALLTFLFVKANSQILKPVTWSYAAKKTSPTTAVIYIKANIDAGWHLYSQFVKEGGPVKTTFNFGKGKDYTIVGRTTEPKPVIKYEPVFKSDVSFFEKSVIFQQKIKFNSKNPTVKGTVEFMTCNDKQCLPPEEIEFSVIVK